MSFSAICGEHPTTHLHRTRAVIVGMALVVVALGAGSVAIVRHTSAAVHGGLKLSGHETPFVLPRLVADAELDLHLRSLALQLDGARNAERQQVAATMERATSTVSLLTLLAALASAILGVWAFAAVRLQRGLMEALAVSEARHRLYAQAEERLTRTMDPRGVLRELARFIVPAIADGCIVHLVEDTRVVFVDVEHQDPDAAQAIRAFEEVHRHEVDEPLGVSRVLRHGHTEWMSHVPRGAALPDELGEDVRMLVNALNLESFIVVPLFARGIPTGAMTLLLSTRTGRRFQDSDVAVAEEVARRASLHLDNALLFREQQHLAEARAQARREREEMLEREMAARAEAEMANRLKDEFLATISHELRTPLMAVLGWVQLLRHGALPEDKRVRALETIERNARAQGQLIEDLLDVSRIMSGKLRLEVKPVDLKKIVETAIGSASPAAENKGVMLCLSPSDDLPTILGDATRLQQVVWNLLSNAVKFTPAGGAVTVTLRALDAHDEHVEIEVRDTGEGIAPDILPSVFERFRQADGSTVRRHGGLGLGLAIVKNIVELHGGQVLVSSEGKGRGATFLVRLPIRGAARRGTVMSETSTPGDPPIVEVLAAPPGLMGLRILVVDDEKDTRDVLKAMLEQGHAQVITASSSAEALEAFIHHTPDILISDIGMPGEDGLSLIRQVRSRPSHAGGNVPAIALTAYGRPEDQACSLRAGFQLHLKKPVAPQELMHSVVAAAGRA